MIGSGHGDTDARLRRLETVTDVTLSGMEADELLPELLDRLRHLLDVDIAVVMLLDQHAQQLVTTAAQGLDEDLRIGLRLAVGRGFAGRVAEQGRVLAIDHVGPSDVVSPIMRAKGIRSLLGAPMLAAGELVGVLVVGGQRSSPFSRDDIQLLQVAADRATVASQVRLSRIDREAALALQRGLLPTRLPPVAGVEMAARYVPGHDTGVGGDWYDVFNLPDGSLGIVVGDVSGRGLRAAVIMGRLRSALRAYALECGDPADALGRLDRKIHHFETGNLATALYAVLTPDRDRLTISMAGHPPPVLTAPGDLPRLLEVPVDLPLGTGTDDLRRQNTTIDVPQGGLLVFYTDGLVERRGTPISDGLTALTKAIGPGTADTVCNAIMTAMDTERAVDDVAVLTLRRLASPLSKAR